MEHSFPRDLFRHVFGQTDHDFAGTPDGQVIQLADLRERRLLRATSRWTLHQPSETLERRIVHGQDQAASYSLLLSTLRPIYVWGGPGAHRVSPDFGQQRSGEMAWRQVVWEQLGFDVETLASVLRRQLSDLRYDCL
jgi:hypothetical protein